MTELDLHGDLVNDHHPRRRGLVSRMRRTASSVIRFRNSSRSQDLSARGYRYTHAHEHYAGALSNSSGNQVEDKVLAGISSAPPPATTTDIVPTSAAPASGDNPGIAVFGCHNLVLSHLVLFHWVKNKTGTCSEVSTNRIRYFILVLL